MIKYRDPELTDGEGWDTCGDWDLDTENRRDTREYAVRVSVTSIHTQKCDLDP